MSMTSLGPSATKIRTQLLDLIATGVFPSNEKLPGERRLAGQFGVSRTVLREALRSLAEDGHVENSVSRGWYVTPHKVMEHVELRSLTEMAHQQRLTVTSQVLAREIRSSTLEESRLLGIAPASSVFDLTRLRSLDGTPICVDRSVLPLARVEALTALEWESTSLYQALESRCGIKVVRSDYTMRAELASLELADWLRIDRGLPVLVGDEIAYGLAGAPVLIGEVSYRGDAYRFQATLFRRNTL